jgi:hypothetical protein
MMCQQCPEQHKEAAGHNRHVAQKSESCPGCANARNLLPFLARAVIKRTVDGILTAWNMLLHFLERKEAMI